MISCKQFSASGSNGTRWCGNSLTRDMVLAMSLMGSLPMPTYIQRSLSISLRTFWTTCVVWLILQTSTCWEKQYVFDVRFKVAARINPLLQMSAIVSLTFFFHDYIWSLSTPWLVRVNSLTTKDLHAKLRISLSVSLKGTMYSKWTSNPDVLVWTPLWLHKIYASSMFRLAWSLKRRNCMFTNQLQQWVNTINTLQYICSYKHCLATVNVYWSNL